VERQLRAVTDRARRLDLLWYLDFPLGVSGTGYDVWRERDVFVRDASGGAPPDAFFTKGQNWGFPPLHPERIREQGYGYLIAALRRHLEHARVLRFDHVMGLHRLYWIPQGMEASDGAYVGYPAKEWWAILALESHRYRAQIVGENLGTVPDAVNEAMARHRIQEMYVLQYEMNPERRHLLRPVPVHSIASLNTHDMPQFAAYWEGSDIDDRVDLGLLSADEAEEEHRGRAARRLKLIDVLRERGLLEPETVRSQAVLEACLSFLAASPAPMVIVNLEDLWQEKEPQNTPGTFRERPNWRRKTRYNLEEIRHLPAVLQVLGTVEKHRRKAEEQMVSNQANQQERQHD
jgi:4-alpha-glucanotransferase